MTIPIIKAIAALIATATLGTGATGTATAAGLADTRTDAAATTVTATADTSSLPDHLINGTFDYPTCPGGKASCDVDPTTGWGGFYKDFGGDNKFAPIDNWDRSKFGWDSDQEGMRPDQQPTSHQKLQHCVQLGHAINNNGQKVNRYAEIIAETPTGAIYQDIATVPGVMYRWTLKHASASTSHADSMAVMIGDPGKETAQEATRTTVNGYGDKLGKVGTTITTKGPGVAWETYTGTYIATSTVTRFTYRSLQGDTKLLHTGNWIDDVSFDKAYKLTYDKNASDATGQVPSDQYGKENTTQPAKTNGNGKVSDLVQRTTTHADGSVTVKTIDTSTDVVSGCQVYYPVGAKIRLATLAKDDDCWDSTMLTRPDVDGRKMKMLGWSKSRYRDDNAGALSTITPTVTMPVGGKTVYAVWVSSGVTLTYNVNTPEGITPPVTPNGITVPYNTVINDTSGWKTGSTTIIPGYRFLGWYTDPRDVIEPTDPRCEIYPTLTICQPQTVPLYPSWDKALTADITVYAHWERADTQVMYDANGGKGSHAPTDGHQHSTIAMPSDVSRSFSRDGYSFAGWNTKPDGSGVSYKDGDGVPVEDKAVTLYAQWRAKIFVMPAAGGDGGPSPLTVIPAVIAGLALMVGLAGTRRRFKASRQTGRHGR